MGGKLPYGGYFQSCRRGGMAYHTDWRIQLEFSGQRPEIVTIL